MSTAGDGARSRRMVAGALVPESMATHAAFFHSSPTIGSQLPFHNAHTGEELAEIEISCSACGEPIQEELLRGTIVAWPNTTEIRYVGFCPDCSSGSPKMMHSVARCGDGSLRRQELGKWTVERIKAPSSMRRFWNRIKAAALRRFDRE